MAREGQGYPCYQHDMMMMMMMIYMMIYIYKILFNPVIPESGIIPIRTNRILQNRILNLNNPGKKLNVNKIHRVNNFLFIK